MTEAAEARRSPEFPGRAAGATAPVIVVGLDGSPASWDAFSWAAGEAARTGGALIAVHASPGLEPAAAFCVPLDYAAADRARQEFARQLAAEAAQRARDACVPLRFVRETGGGTRALASVARSAGADVVVVGRSAKMLHRLAGSPGRRLACRHDAPVVVVVP